MTSISNDVPAASTAGAGLDPKLGAGGAPAGDAEVAFGQLMAQALGALSDATGSGLGEAKEAAVVADAAGAPAVLSAQGEGVALEAAALGPGLELLTPASPAGAPDEQSLLAFARGQGLDEQALNWLFPGGLAAQAAPVAVAAGAVSPGLLAPVAPLSPVAPLAPLVPATAPTPSAPVGAQGAQGQSALVQLGALFASPWLAPGAGSAAGGDAPDVAVSAPVVSLPAAMPAPKLVLNAAVPAQGAAAPELALAGAAVAAEGDATEEIDLQLEVEGALEPESPSLQRILGLLREINGKQLDGKLGKAGAAPEAVPGAPGAPGVPATSGLATASTVPLAGASAPLSSANVLSSADAGALWRANTGGQAAAQAAAQAVATASADQQGRVDAFDALGQRLGEAMGERIKAQFERGNWQVKFNLSPQALGQVEVELRMRAGEMEAALRAPQALTRELLAEGLPRLREVLSQSGIDVASFHIGQGQSQNSGGRSTPRQDAGVGAAGPKGSGESVAKAPASASVRSRHDGFDVVV